MKRFRIFPLVLVAVFIAAVCAPAPAQTAEDPAAAGLKVRIVPQHEQPTPFLPGAGTSRQVQSIEFRTAAQMSQKDRDLLVDAEAAISERAGFAGLEFDQGQWSTLQIVCPALPNHLLLRFKRNGGAGDVSLFSASIPRGDVGHVRIIAIQRRGYSLFSPAPINALTISAFNHIRAEEPAGSTPDWLETGLCYAALAGARPQVAQVAKTAEDQIFPAAMPATLEVPIDGGAIIHFADVATPSRPMEWTMTFNGKGRLLKATHSPASLITVKSFVPVAGELKSKPLPATIVDLKGKPVPATDSSPKFKLTPVDSGAQKFQTIPGSAQPQPTPQR
ncbi:MAG: hypothetical protein P4K86_03445 [Terracidiphilus sp.]|nr:hypothetical protein [Terracidiphilus sp.]MDR3777169.1 hypothetical protein [Terracidiphilus sp.]